MPLNDAQLDVKKYHHYIYYKKIRKDALCVFFIVQKGINGSNQKFKRRRNDTSMGILRFIGDNAFPTIISSIAVALVGFLGNMIKRYKNLDKYINKRFEAVESSMNSRFDLIVGALLSISHDRLYQACMFYITTDEITVEELSNLEYLFNGYASLGGNGTGEELYKKCKQLPIVKVRTKYLNNKTL